MQTCTTSASTRQSARSQDAPRFGSAISCASSITAVLKRVFVSASSTVEETICAPSTGRYSSPVSMLQGMLAALILSYISSASRRSGLR